MSAKLNRVLISLAIELGIVTMAQYAEYVHNVQHRLKDLYE